MRDPSWPELIGVLLALALIAYGVIGRDIAAATLACIIVLVILFANWINERTKGGRQ